MSQRWWHGAEDQGDHKHLLSHLYVLSVSWLTDNSQIIALDFSFIVFVGLCLVFANDCVL